MEENPFQSPAVHVTPQREESLAIDYWRPVTFAFDSPNWFMNILLIGVLQLIPIVGPMVMIGYQYEIVVALLRGGQRGYPDFDFNRFSEYLMRGLWPFLVALAWSFLFAFIVFGMFLVGGGIVVAMVSGASNGDAEAMVPIIVGLYFMAFLVMMVLSVVMQAFIMPLMLRSALQKDFMAGMKLAFAFQFLGKTWKELVIMLCVILLFALVASAVGMLFCFVGVYVTIGAVLIGQAHAWAQLYQLHVSRGGEPVPIVD